MAQPLTALNTFGVEATCDNLFRFTSEQDIQDWLAGMPIAPEKFFVLGGGSNLLLLGHIPLTFLKADITGITYEKKWGPSVGNGGCWG